MRSAGSKQLGAVDFLAGQRASQPANDCQLVGRSSRGCGRRRLFDWRRGCSQQAQRASYVLVGGVAAPKPSQPSTTEGSQQTSANAHTRAGCKVLLEPTRAAARATVAISGLVSAASIRGSEKDLDALVCELTRRSLSCVVCDCQKKQVLTKRTGAGSSSGCWRALLSAV